MTGRGTIRCPRDRVRAWHRAGADASGRPGTGHRASRRGRRDARPGRASARLRRLPRGRRSSASSESCRRPRPASPRSWLAAMRTVHLRLAMSAGARGVVPAEPRPEELAAALLDAVGASPPAQERRRDGRVVAVCGAKGGVGATTVAVGIAAAASGMLVDAAAGHGTLAGHLGCHPQRSLADLARLAGSVGAEAVAAVRTEHPSGIGVLAGLSEPDLVGLLPSGLGARSPGNAGRWPAPRSSTSVGRDLRFPSRPRAARTPSCSAPTPDALAATCRRGNRRHPGPPRRRPGCGRAGRQPLARWGCGAVAGDRSDRRRSGARRRP